MATTFDSMTSDIAPYVPGCPTAVMSNTIRKVAIDLCERAKVWRVPLTGVVAVFGTYNYPLVSNIANTEVSDIVAAKQYRALTKTTKNMKILTSEVVFNTEPSWPDSNTLAEPYAVFKMDESTFNLVPIPDSADTYTIFLYAAIRPTITSTGWDSGLATAYKKVIFHGALHDLMRMNDREWTDISNSQLHGKQWTYYLSAAKARANKGFGRAELYVKQTPFG